MHYLRALTGLAVLCGFCTGDAWAFSQRIATSAEGESSQGTRETLSYTADGLAGHWSLQGALSRVAADYDTIQVRDRNGNLGPLSTQASGQGEYLLQAGLQWNKGDDKLGASGTATLSSSPFPAQSGSAFYERALASQTSRIRLQGSWAKQGQPVDYYTDSNFSTQQRPVEVNASALRLSLEQLMSERWKVGFEVSTGIRIEDRPRNWGAEIKQAYALTDYWFIQLRGGGAFEPQNQNLKNERGYFDIAYGELQATYEPIYDLLITLSYGLVVEHEALPVARSTSQVGSDQFGMEVSYRWGEFDFRLLGSYRLTNLPSRDLGISGEVAWNL